jgi:hypothetical protein
MGHSKAVSESVPEPVPPPAYGNGDGTSGAANTTTTDPTSNATPPPNYAFPTAFVIMDHRTAPLVTSSMLKRHLALLNAFALLRKSIEEIDDPAQEPVKPWPAEKERRWSWFVAFAVDR